MLYGFYSLLFYNIICVVFMKKIVHGSVLSNKLEDYLLLEKLEEHA